MSPRARAATWLGGLILAYVARPISCGVALGLEVRPPDHPYHSVDPHGFGLLFAWASALALAVPTLWLLGGGLRRDLPPDAELAGPARHLCAAAVLLVLGSPQLMQASYLRGLAIDVGWPIVASCLTWAALVAIVAWRPATAAPSAQASFARHPRLCWALLAAVTAGSALPFIL